LTLRYATCASPRLLLMCKCELEDVMPRSYRSRPTKLGENLAVIVQRHRALSRGKGGNCHPATRIAGTLYGLQRGGSQDPLDRTNELSYNKGTPFPPTNVQFGYVRWPKITTGRKQQVGLQTTIGTNNSVRANSTHGWYVHCSIALLFKPGPAAGPASRAISS
jgi:hypothetical protein